MPRIMSLETTETATDWALLAPTKRQLRAAQLLVDKISAAAPESEIGSRAAIVSESIRELLSYDPRSKVTLKKRDGRMLATPRGDRS